MPTAHPENALPRTVPGRVAVAQLAWPRLISRLFERSSSRLVRKHGLTEYFGIPVYLILSKKLIMENLDTPADCDITALDTIFSISSMDPRSE